MKDFVINLEVWWWGPMFIGGGGVSLLHVRYVSGVVVVVHQGRLHSLGLMWRQCLIWDVWRGWGDSLCWHRKVIDLS